MYDSDIGRFYARDPAGEGYSPYNYARNNSVSFVDPDGKMSLQGYYDMAKHARAQAEMEAENHRLMMQAWGYANSMDWIQLEYSILPEYVDALGFDTYTQTFSGIGGFGSAYSTLFEAQRQIEPMTLAFSLEGHTFALTGTRVDVMGASKDIKTNADFRNTLVFASWYANASMQPLSQGGPSLAGPDGGKLSDLPLYSDLGVNIPFFGLSGISIDFQVGRNGLVVVPGVYAGSPGLSFGFALGDPTLGFQSSVNGGYGIGGMATVPLNGSNSYGINVSTPGVAVEVYQWGFTWDSIVKWYNSLGK